MRTGFMLRALFWSALLFTMVMALLPKPPQLPVNDKWQHIAAFAVLTALMALAYRRSLILNAVILIGVGALIEVLQAIEVLNRSSDAADLVADSIAVIVVTAIAFAVRGMATRTAASSPRA